MRSSNEFIDELLLPFAPCRWTGRSGIGFGERMEKFESVVITDRRNDVGDRRRIVVIATRSHLREQQVVFDHRHERRGIRDVKSHSRRDVSDEFHADLGVVTFAPFADVVEQRAD